MKNYIVGKKYPMRNGDWSEYCDYEETDILHSLQYPLTFVGSDGVKMAYTADGKACIGRETEYDIISDKPIEENANKEAIGFFKESLSLSDEAFNKKFLERRQFDVSKVSQPMQVPENEYYNDISTVHQIGESFGEYKVKQQVLEAWNNGTIEELLEGWTK